MLQNNGFVGFSARNHKQGGDGKFMTAQERGGLSVVRAFEVRISASSTKARCH
jgi:hypothetical protein